MQNRQQTGRPFCVSECRQLCDHAWAGVNLQTTTIDGTFCNQIVRLGTTSLYASREICLLTREKRCTNNAVWQMTLDFSLLCEAYD